MIGRTLLTLAAAALMPTAAVAHHGWSSYDSTKELKITGTLSNLSWGNPHATAKTRYQGKLWDVILAPVTRMETRGLTKAMVGPKQRVTLVGYPRADGTAEMRIERVIIGDKTVELR